MIKPEKKPGRRIKEKVITENMSDFYASQLDGVWIPVSEAAKSTDVVSLKRDIEIWLRNKGFPPGYVRQVFEIIDKNMK